MTSTNISDAERREVAARLREFAKDKWSLTVGGNSSTIRYAISDIVFGDKKYHSGVDLLDRLADLIEPSEPKVRCVAEVKVDGERLEELAHDAVVELTGIDRDALLKLAYMLQVMGERSDEKGRYDLGITFTSIADRIRKALGVES